MTKIVVRLPEPRKEYTEDNQRQINRTITSLIELLNCVAWGLGYTTESIQVVLIEFVLTPVYHTPPGVWPDSP